MSAIGDKIKFDPTLSAIDDIAPLSAIADTIRTARQLVGPDQPRSTCYDFVVNASELPQAVARLLWDVDVRDIDLERHRSLVLERVMTRGTWEAMKWLRQRYATEVIADFVKTRGRRLLAPRDLAYWSLVCNVEDVAQEDDVGGGRPRWAGA